jgi:lysophospholipase L1-like esterase
MKSYVKVAMVIALGLGAGALGFWVFSQTAFYKKIRQGKALIVQEAQPIVYITDPQVGPMLLPHVKIHYRTPYFETSVVTNADGFTGRDYPLKTGNYRIAILGDSAVEAYAVADTNRFPQLTESLIYNKTGGKLKVEVMGFGVSGWGTVHEYGAIRKYVLKYHPDEIWLMFLTTNDTGDNTPLMNGPPNGPTFVYKNRESDEIVDIAFGYPDVPEALEAERQRRYGTYLKDTWTKWTDGLLPYFWSAEHDPQWDLVLSHTLQTLRLAKKLCDENHIKLALVYRVNGYDQDKGNFEAFRKEAAGFLKRDLPMEQALGVRRFRKQVEDLGIDFINMLDMKEDGISTRQEEMETSKHFATANFFSDLIIKRLTSEHKIGADAH